MVFFFIVLIAQASFTAEGIAQNPNVSVDETNDQRLRELETLLSEYKSTNDTLMKELDLIKGDSSTERGLRRKGSSEDIQPAELEDESSELQSTSIIKAFTHETFFWKMCQSKPPNTLRRSRNWNRSCLILEAKSVLGDMSHREYEFCHCEIILIKLGWMCGRVPWIG
jgi:hypothetical protein